MTNDAAAHLVELDARPSLREHVRHSLRAAIVTGELETGRVYSAPVLAATFGVSATPVREAMLDLIKEGLVERLPNKGYRVVEISEQDLDDITALRRLVEPAGMRDAVPHVPESEFGRLRGLAQLVIEAASQEDLVAYVDHDREFHLAILGYCGNRRLVELVAELRARTRLYGLPVLAAHHDLAATAAEHVQLMDLIERRDAPAVEALMQQHLGHVRGLWARPTS